MLIKNCAEIKPFSIFTCFTRSPGKTHGEPEILHPLFSMAPSIEPLGKLETIGATAIAEEFEKHVKDNSIALTIIDFFMATIVWKFGFSTRI